MIWFTRGVDAPMTKAYLAADLSDEDLKKMKSLFEFGTHADIDPMLEMKILKAPVDWIGKPHTYMREKETESGNEGPFVVIDEAFTERGGIWYIDRFADEEEVEEDMAESTKVLWKILVKPEHLAIMWVNYDIANMDIQEDLGNCGVDFPIDVGFHQPDVHDAGGLDMEEEKSHQPAWITAAPGEFEVSTEEEHLNMFIPRHEKVARLKKEIAEANGLISDWTIPSEAKGGDQADGTTREFPEGSVGLQVNYDPKFGRPKYKWPEGSL